jgi:hypothetical protein
MAMMSPEGIRARADTFDPMKDVNWTPWQALAWIVHRDPDKVRECSEIWRLIGPSFPVEGAPLGPFRNIWSEIGCDFEVSKGWAEFWRVLESGSVTASGEDANGLRRKISGLEWIDLQFYEIFTEGLPNSRHSETDGPQCYRKYTEFTMRPKPMFHGVRVLVADVLKEFPAADDVTSVPVPTIDLIAASAPSHPIAQESIEALNPETIKRRRGPRPVKLPGVIEAMRASDQFRRLDEMTEAEMEVLFGASRDTCRKARNLLLPPGGETPTNSNK